jgi:hypothetical protein
MRPKSSRSERSRALELALAAAAILAGLVTTPPGAVVQAQQAGSVPYPLVYVRAPRLGDTTLTHWPEVMNAIRQEPGSDLILRQPSGSEEVLFAAGNGGVMDPVVSFDARKVLFAYSPDLRASALNSQRANAPRAGWDIYAIDLASRQVTRLTQQEWTPPSGAVNWSSELLSAAPANSYYLGYGVFNLGPMPLPGGRIAFSSSRDGYLPNKNWAFPNLRLYVMDEDGSNVEKIGHLNIGSALHPTVLADGRIMFASWEAEANRDPRVWGLWAIHPDGSNWEPLFSAFNLASALHFQTQFSDRRIGVIDYYNLNNHGFGTLLAFKLGPRGDGAMHGSPLPGDPSNPAVGRGYWWFQPGHPTHKQPRFRSYRFSPTDLVNLTAFTHGEDEAASYDPSSPDNAPVFAGKVTHPSAAPNNEVLVVWSRGPVNLLDRPTTLPRVDGGIYLMSANQPMTDHKQLRRIVDRPEYNEMMPRAVVPYSAVYGITEPARLPELVNGGGTYTALPAGTPYGIVGTSTFMRRNTKPGASDGDLSRWEGYDPFNTAENDGNPNWFTQGADAGKYGNDDIYAVRIIAMEGVANKSYGPLAARVGFKQHGENERYRILGEIPLRKRGAQGQVITDPDGNPDTSFWARIPADVSFTFQTLDKDGLVLNFAQTWHQLRPGEVRTNCGGCHAHAQAPLPFAQTAAGRDDPAAPLVLLGEQTLLLTKAMNGDTTTRIVPQRAVTVEFLRDIKPILTRSCVACHNATLAEAGLRLDDSSVVGGVENTWNRLANDREARYGIKPVINGQTWRQTNTSRYIRAFQSRRSLLMWKLMGRRLDGWTNASYPTEAVPGDPATLPAGTNRNDADIDFTGTIMPPPGSGVPALSEDEKMLFARWIDLGAPVNESDPVAAAIGWEHDELPPTLTVQAPARGTSTRSLRTIRLGAYDIGGLDWASLSVRSSVALAGRAANAELADLFAPAQDGVRTLVLASTLDNARDAVLTVRVADTQGNVTTIVREFSIDTDMLLRDGFE